MAAPIPIVLQWWCEPANDRDVHEDKDKVAVQCSTSVDQWVSILFVVLACTVLFMDTAKYYPTF